MRAQILSLSIILLCSQTLGEKCLKELHSLANKQQRFVFCTTIHAVPVEICTGCKAEYDDMIGEYQEFMKNCSQNYLDNDRLNIVSTTQSILVGLWTRAYCEDCFTNNNIEVFNGKFTEFDTCLNTTKNVCVSCLGVYQDLNDFYKNLDQHNNAKVCYDIQDKMNRTRSHWSTDFHCCHRTFDITLFLVSGSFCVLLPFLFYGGMFWHGKRRERNHGVIDADTEDVAPLVVDGVVPNRQEATVESSTNHDDSSVPHKSEQPNPDSEDSEDSDDAAERFYKKYKEIL